jgi:hypothetical protein
MAAPPNRAPTKQGDAAHRPLTGTEGQSMTADVHYACAWPPHARKTVVTLIVIIVLGLTAAAMTGHGRVALTATILAMLAAAVEELLRAIQRYWLRTA